MMKRWFAICICIFLAASLIRAQDVTEAPEAEATAEATPAALTVEATAEATAEVIVEADRSSGTAWFSANTGTPLVGEPIDLALTIKIPTGDSLVSWPDLPADWTPFMVTKAGEISQSEDNGTQIYQQTFTVILWEPGDYQTPETTIIYQSPGTGRSYKTRVEEAFFTVPTVLDGVDFQLRPFKPQIWLFYMSPWLVLTGIAGLVGITGGVIRWRRIRATSGTAPVGNSPIELALAELASLDRQNLPTRTLYPLVADCLRVYIERRYSIQTHEMTTSELVGEMRAHQVLPEQLQHELRWILEHADLVKFARFQPGKRANQRLLAVSRGWLVRAESAAPVADQEQLT